MFEELFKFRRAKFIWSCVSGLGLGLVFSLSEIGCWECLKSSLSKVNIGHFLSFSIVVFMFVWFAYSYAKIGEK